MKHLHKRLKYSKINGTTLMDLLFDTPETDKRKEKIHCWAKRYMASGSDNLNREKELIKRKESIYKQGYLTKSELEQLVRWKLPRQLGNIRKNDEDLIVETTQAAFKTKNVSDSIAHLCRIKGVRVSIGSAILHLFHKDDFPIYDQHALRAVGEQQYESIWESYVAFCRKVAKDNNVDMRTLDRALYRFGYVLSVLNYYEDDLACLGVTVDAIINPNHS